jgi:hypothetical protein
MMAKSLVCPKCGCTDVSRSRRRWYDKLFSWFGYYPFTCDEMECEKRFYQKRRG